MFSRRIAAVLIAASLAVATVGAILAIPTPSAPFGTHVAVCGNIDAPANATVGGACYLPTMYHGAPTLDTSAYGTDIPRCASDDWNSDHVARCYTERVTDGAVLIIDQADNVVATLK